MRNLLIKSAFIFSITGASLSIASDTMIDDETHKEHRIISAADLNETDIEKFCLEGMEGAHLSIENTELIFDLDIDSNIFKIEDPKPVKAKVLKTAFLKCEGGKHYFSYDYRTWRRLRDYLTISISLCPETKLVKITLHLNVPEKKD